MSAAFDFGQQVRDQVDIVAVVREYVPRLTKRGTRWTANCPFHNERTASFGVNETLRIFKCFGCGKGGNVIAFVMEMESLSWWEACKSLAERHGIPLPKRDAQADEDAKRRSGLYEMHELAVKLYRDQLLGPGGAEARAYIQKRGVPKAQVEEFAIGMAPRDGLLYRKLREGGFAPEQAEASGLVVKRQDGSGYFDRFRGRLMFPIHNESGKVIGFGGRAMSDEDQPKYLNSPETELYHKKLVLYNLNRARKHISKLDHSILVEGYMDVIGLATGGVLEAVAGCGTALGAEQARVLRRFSENVVINYDPDRAGQDAARKAISLMLEERMRIRVLELPGGLDPDEFVLHHGAEAYQKLVREAPRYFHWLADRARTEHDMRDAEGRLAAFKQLLPEIQKLPDRIDRAATAEDLASYLHVDKGMVLDQLKRTASDRQAPPKFLATQQQIPPVERLLLRCLLDSDQARSEVLPRLTTARFERPLVTGNILRTMASLGGAFDWDALEGRLDDQDRTLLTRVVFADEVTGDQNSAGFQSGSGDTLAAQALRCLEALETREVESRYRDIKQQIAEAERAGDLKLALELSAELNRMGGAGRRQRT